MNWDKENPCFGCTAMMPDGQIRKGPCCWEVGLELTEGEYQRHFFGKPNVQLTVLYERRIDDDPTLEQISISDACPNLDRETGSCLIENDKPDNCRRAQPKRFSICSIAPGGRWSDWYVNSGVV